jgi:hypothetical protein
VQLLGVRYLVVPVGLGLPRRITGSTVVRANGYDLIELDGWEPRVSVVASWSIVGDPLAALQASLLPGFDPGTAAVLETDPGISPEPVALAGSATYAESDPENVVVTVEATAPSIVVVRNNWDTGWTATVDGAGAPVLPADGFRQGIPVTAGHHVISLTYRDPWIARGIAASAAVWGAWAACVIAATIRSRRRRSDRPSAP